MMTTAVPRIGRGFRLQWEEVQNCYVLLYPEGMVRLNRSAGAILSRCDGGTDVAGIVVALEREFGATGLADDVEKFFDIAVRNRWVEWAEDEA